ncbi:hypothetical protein WCD74_03085 [Actinomycetospora sp. OC33-EN08]|uniref:Uncharacterized protein n=1 Tax=Actinomycetospora aurantiaca TaxID=3129233 RepID=A0ABU8MHG3_9PSEU
MVRTPNLRLLSVVDRGTKGLGGPTRADQLATGRKDWVSFVLNVGEKRDTEQGGGTYGYGKAVLYRMSKVGTILVYSRTDEPGRGLESRLIGIALGDSFDSSERVDAGARPFTGRHWWGEVQGDHVEPLRGPEADRVARSLGLLPFAEDESGTTLIVLDPDLDEFDDDSDTAADHLANTIAWQLWPIMLPERGDDRLAAEVVSNGSVFRVPDPAATYPLDMFVAAYRKQRDGHGTVLECKRPRRALGRFAVQHDFVVPMSKDSVTLAADCAGVPGDPHHICLMRSPELVVKYLSQTETGSVNRAYAGVFRAVDELDDVYAAAEPPTHDNWVHEQLTGNDQTFVRTTFRRIKEQLDEFRTTEVTTSRAESGVALGAASSFLGGIVAAAFAQPDDGVGGAGSRGGGRAVGSGNGSGGGRPSPGRRPRISALTEPIVDERAGRVVLMQRFSVSGPGPARLEAKLSVGLGSRAREDDAPAGGRRPEILAWSTPDGEIGGDHCVVATPAEVGLIVIPVPDTVTDIAVLATKNEEGAS